jgi:hypothetical protein
VLTSNVAIVISPAGHRGYVFLTSPVARATLQARAALYVALLIEGGTCWSAGNDTTLNGRSTTALTAVSTPLHGGIGNSSLIEVRLPPPADGEWTQRVGLYSDTVLLIGIPLLCGGAGGSSHVLTLQVPAPGLSQALSGEVRSVTTAGQWVSLAGQPGSSGAVARVTLSRTLQLCGSGDISGLIAVPTRCQGDDGTAGNLVAAACGLALALALCSGVALVSAPRAPSTAPFVDAMRRLAFPSCLLPLLVAILPSTAGMSVVQLVGAATSAGCDSVNGALGVLGLLYCVAVVAGALGVFFWTRGHMEVHKVQRGAQPALPLLRLVNAMMARRYRWRHTDPTAASADRHVALVLQEYRLVWFFCLDAAVLLASGVLVGVAQASGETAVCAGCGAAIAVMYLAEGVTCAVQRPFTTLFGHVYCAVSLGLSAVSVALQTANLLLQWGESTDYDTLNRLLLGSAVCDLCVMGISLVRLALDLKSLLHSLRRLVSCSKHKNDPDESLTAVLFTELDDGNGKWGVEEEIVECYDDHLPLDPFDYVVNADEDDDVATRRSSFKRVDTSDPLSDQRKPSGHQNGSSNVLRRSSTLRRTQAADSAQVSQDLGMVADHQKFSPNKLIAVDEGTVVLNHILQIKLLTSSTDDLEE